MKERKWQVTLTYGVIMLAIALFISVFVSISLGSANLSLITVWKVIVSKIPFVAETISHDWKLSAEAIIWDIRLPRIVLAMVVGASLAIAGVAFQGVLRNPLADPYILGISSGAAFGAATVILFGIQTVLFGSWTVPIVAFVSGLLTLFMVLALSNIRGAMGTEVLILSGVVVQAFVGAMLTFLMTMTDDKLKQIFYWSLGSLALREWAHAWVVIPFLIIGFIVLSSFSREMNIVALGEQSAKYMGVRIKRLKLVVFITATFVTAAAVSVSGTIGFVGLVIPHMIRMVVGPDYRLLFPLSALGGALFLLWADTLARNVMAPGELPIGVITAFLGAPFFAYLLRHHKKSYFGSGK